MYWEVRAFIKRGVYHIHISSLRCRYIYIRINNVPNFFSNNSIVFFAQNHYPLSVRKRIQDIDGTWSLF